MQKTLIDKLAKGDEQITKAEFISNWDSFALQQVWIRAH
jgi:hypothetical protein